MRNFDIKKYLKGKVLVIIDAANLENSLKDMGWKIDYLKLKSLFDNESLIEIRDYCVRHNTKNQNDFFTFLKRNGYKLVTKPLKIIRDIEKEKGHIRKANFDVEITCDVLERSSEFETLVLFSGDSDFDYLIKRIRGKGRRCIVVPSKYHISKELINSCNKYVDIKKLKKLVERK